MADPQKRTSALLCTGALQYNRIAVEHEAMKEDIVMQSYLGHALAHEPDLGIITGGQQRLG